MWVCVALIIIAAVGAWATFRDVPTRTPAELYDRTEIFGGYTAYLSENLYVSGVHGSSMEPTFGEGDYVIWVEVNPSELKIGDVIIFEHGRLVAHRIVGVINQNGAYKWRTKGDNRAVADDKTAISAFLVTEDDLKGLVIGVVYGHPHIHSLNKTWRTTPDIVCPKNAINITVPKVLFQKRQIR